MQFTFPQQVKNSYSSPQQIKEYLLNSLIYENLHTYCQYKFRQIRNQYLYCLCRDCPARLVFKKENGVYVLLKSKLNHQHSQIKAKKQYIIQTIKEYPSCFNNQTIKRMTIAKFQISTATFYRYLRQSKSMGENLDNVLTALEASGIFGVKINSLFQSAQLPGILLLTSQSMIQKYRKNGMVIKFDLTYNLIREKVGNNGQYSVGIFITQNNNLNIEPVAFAIMDDESKDSFMRVFTEFFYLMKSPPHIIITDEQKAMKFALEQLKERGVFEGQHFIDIFHVLRNAKKNLFYKPYINNLVALSRSSHLLQYSSKRRVCYQKMSGRDREILANFQDKLQKCCIARIPPVFIGLSCTTNSVQKINDIIKSKLNYSQKYNDVVSQLSKLLIGIIQKKRQPNIEKMKVEQLTAIQQIKELRYQLCKPVFRKLMTELSLSSTCLVNTTDQPNTYFIQQAQFEENESFTVQFNSIQGVWICQCKFTQKVGIPCAHLIKIMLLRRQKLITRINPWWLIDFNKKENSVPIAFPRKTRRHFK